MNFIGIILLKGKEYKSIEYTHFNLKKINNMVSYRIFLIFFFLVVSCKDKDNQKGKVVMNSQEKRQGFRPDWVDKVGAKENKFKDSTYFVNNYNAINDGSALTTNAIQKTIDDCFRNGGGTVAFKPGIYLTGSIFIKEGVHFIVHKGVEIRGSENIEDYPLIDTRVAGVELEWPAALINVRDQKMLQ